MREKLQTADSRMWRWLEVLSIRSEVWRSCKRSIDEASDENPAPAGGIPYQHAVKISKDVSGHDNQKEIKNIRIFWFPIIQTEVVWNNFLYREIGETPSESWGYGFSRLSWMRCYPVSETNCKMKQGLEHIKKARWDPKKLFSLINISLRVILDKEF